MSSGFNSFLNILIFALLFGIAFEFLVGVEYFAADLLWDMVPIILLVCTNEICKAIREVAQIQQINDCNIDKITIYQRIEDE